MSVQSARPVSAKQVKAWRLRHGLTREMAAATFAISERQWSRYEQEHSPIPGWLRRAVRKGAP